MEVLTPLTKGSVFLRFSSAFELESLSKERFSFFFFFMSFVRYESENIRKIFFALSFLFCFRLLRRTLTRSPNDHHVRPYS